MSSVNENSDKLHKITGKVFDIQRSSIHDGPGLRTTVFFKGCPLQCLWCHNPESISSKPELMFMEYLCINCAFCFGECPNSALVPNSSGRIDQSKCIACGKCVQSCAPGALQLTGIEKSVGEILEEIKLDIPFFSSSGGGVTFSGGEPLLQGEFLAALLMSAKNYGVNTAVDTAGHFSWEAMEAILPYLDLVLYDLKHMNAVKHQKLTGVGNKLILANLTRLAQTDVDIIIRVPIIPGYTDELENIQQTAKFIRTLKKQPQVELLPYHGLAESKYAQLNKAYSLVGTNPPGDDFMEKAEKVFIKENIEVRIV